MLDLVTLAAKIVIDDGCKGKTLDKIVEEITTVYSALKGLNENGEKLTEAAEVKQLPEIKEIQSSFGEKVVKCLICGRDDLKVLGRHLFKKHGMHSDEYREKFGLSGNFPLVSTQFHTAQSSAAKERGFGRMKNVMRVLNRRITDVPKSPSVDSGKPAIRRKRVAKETAAA